MPGDLHTHSNFSDGSSDIERLPLLAQRAGLSHLAVSDHDTALSIQYAMENPVQHGVTMIPAVELTCFDAKRQQRVHMLCYYPALTQELMAFFKQMADRRNEANEKSMVEIEQLYPQFSGKEAKAIAQRGGVLYKTHLIRLLHDYGYTDGIYTDLYRQLFGRPNGTVLHEAVYESTDAVLALIQQAKGVAVLAHPSVYHSMELCTELAQAGRIDGVEIEHPRNTPQDKAQLYALAQKHKLIITGGTDFHGMHTARPTPLGAITTQDESIVRMATLAQSRRESLV